MARRVPPRRAPARRRESGDEQGSWRQRDQTRNEREEGRRALRSARPAPVRMRARRRRWSALPLLAQKDSAHWGAGHFRNVWLCGTGHLKSRCSGCSSGAIPARSSLGRAGSSRSEPDRWVSRWVSRLTPPHRAFQRVGATGHLQLHGWQTRGGAGKTPPSGSLSAASLATGLGLSSGNDPSISRSSVSPQASSA